MPLANYTTTVPYEKSLGEITALLVASGAREISTQFDNFGTPTAVKFRIERPEGNLFFALPVDWQRTLKVLCKAKGIGPRYCTDDHAKMVAWRCVRDWLRAQLALVEIGNVSFDQVMMSYVLLPDGNTLYDQLVLSNFKGLLPESTAP